MTVPLRWNGIVLQATDQGTVLAGPRVVGCCAKDVLAMMLMLGFCGKWDEYAGGRGCLLRYPYTGAGNN